jgi:hypothetical protein
MAALAQPADRTGLLRGVCRVGRRCVQVGPAVGARSRACSICGSWAWRSGGRVRGRREVRETDELRSHRQHSHR